MYQPRTMYYCMDELRVSSNHILTTFQTSSLNQTSPGPIFFEVQDYSDPAPTDKCSVEGAYRGEHGRRPISCLPRHTPFHARLDNLWCRTSRTNLTSDRPAGWLLRTAFAWLCFEYFTALPD